MRGCGRELLVLPFNDDGLSPQQESGKAKTHTMFNVWISLRVFGADVLYNIVYYMTFKSVQSRGNKPESGTLMLSYPLVTIFDYCVYDYFYFYDYFRARRTHLSPNGRKNYISAQPRKMKYYIYVRISYQLILSDCAVAWLTVNAAQR